MDFNRSLKLDPSMLESMLNLAIDIQQIAAPTFSEHDRGKFVHSRFVEEGLCDIHLDKVGNLYGRLPGKGHAKPVIVSAHLDTVFPVETELSVRRESDKICGPGIGDNSLGVAGLFGLLWALRQEWGNGEKLPGDIWLIANVGEEALGNLNGMRAVVDRFGETALAYLVLEGMALGQVYNRALGVQRYQIQTRTDGGHSWVDFGAPSAIHELALLISQLTALALPESPRSTLNVGVMSGGISVNTIASEAHLELDLRSEDDTALTALTRHVHTLVQDANKPGIKMFIEQIGERPPGQISPEHPLIQLAQQCLLKQGIQPNLTIGSTDANIPLNRGLPAVCIGLTTGYGAHTTNEYINTKPLEQGIAQLVALVNGLYSELS